MSASDGSVRAYNEYRISIILCELERSQVPTWDSANKTLFIVPSPNTTALNLKGGASTK